MLWIILFFLLILIVVGLASAGTRNQQTVNSQAEYERLKRLAPDDPLAQVGPSEFERAYNEVKQNKAKQGCMPLIYLFIAGFFIGPFLGWMAYTATDESVGTGLFVYVIVAGAGLYYGLRGAKRAQVAPTHDEIAEHLGLRDPGD